MFTIVFPPNQIDHNLETEPNKKKIGSNLAVLNTTLHMEFDDIK